VQKLNRLAKISVGLTTLLLALTTTSFAANYKKGSAPEASPAAPTGNYKGVAASQTSRSYKGEIAVKKPVPTPAPIKAAGPALVPIVLKEGPYFGAAAGYDSYKIQQLTQLVGTTNITFNPAINATGLIGGIMGGYGHYFNNALYLGLEAFLNISQAYQSTNLSVSDTTDDISYNAKFFATTGYGASLLPGIKLSDSALVYVRLGYQVARLRGQENLQEAISGLITVSNTSSWSGGISYGLGFEEAMVENFSLRGEYIHTDYRSFQGTSGTQYSPSNNQFLLALIYHIA
jgi:opacity protein-like surface antigen